jgi:hypothetical protein
MRTRFAYLLSRHRKIGKQKWSLFLFFQDFPFNQFLYEIRDNFPFAFQNTLPLADLLISCFLAKAVSLYEWAIAYTPNFLI